MARAIAEVERRTTQQLAKAKWRSSGLSDQHARRLGLRALDSAQVQAKCSRFHEAGALLIPYFDISGRPTKFYRVRYLEKLPGAAGLSTNPQRYDQPTALGAVKGLATADARMLEAYYPPLVDWAKIAKNVETSICITEGELKAACACANKIPMLALGGVYSFMSGGRAIDFLPSMKQVEWEGRKVYVVYDNDLSCNPDVLRAQNLLAERLLSRGARVSYVTIPPGPDKGVDDFIAGHGAKAFVALIDDAGPFLESQALWQLNSEVVFIKNDGVPIIVERDSGIAVNPDIFARHLYANRHYMAQVEKGSGKHKHVVLEKEKLAPRWIEWESRSELEKLTYEPGMPKVIDEAAWNTWCGWGAPSKKGDVGPWHALLDFLFDRDPRARRYFEQWCAYPIQNPGAKLYTAVLLWSRVKRLGKSMIGLALKYIYGDNAVFVNSRQLKSTFNTWAKDRQLVIGEEIGTGEGKMDADYMKDIITNPYFTINSKFKAEYTIPNHTNFLHFSNNPNAILLEDGDKRYMIHAVHHRTPKPRAFYEGVDKWLHGSGPSHLRHYLENLSVRGFNPREHAPDTASKLEMITASKNREGLWVLRLQDDPKNALRRLGARTAEGCDLFTMEQLYSAFDPDGRDRGAAASLGKHLQSAGMRSINGGVPIGTANGVHRLRAIRNVEKWEQATRKEIREHYNLYFGPQVAGGVK